MPRIRTIKPQFWIDEDLATVSREVRLLYIGLWNICDDSGVFEWRPGRIKAQLFPNDNDLTPDIIEQWLCSLEKIRNVQRISQNGSTFGYIPTFLKHQDIFKPSQWRYLTSNLPVGEESPTSNLPVGEESVKEKPSIPPYSSPLPSLKEKEKEKEKEKIHNIDDDIGTKETSEIFKVFENDFQKLTPTNSQQLGDLIDNYKTGPVLVALKQAIKMNKRSLAYVEGILKPKQDQKSRYTRVN